VLVKIFAQSVISCVVRVKGGGDGCCLGNVLFLPYSKEMLGSISILLICDISVLSQLFAHYGQQPPKEYFCSIDYS
jgi:hypothetical protein